MARTKGAHDADYEVKRAALIDKVLARLSRTNETRPSLRQLADGAGVSIPTLRHYFGDRDAIIAAVLEEWGRRGAPFLQAAAQPKGDFRESVADYVGTVALAYQYSGFANIMAMGFIEGLLHARHGPTFLKSAFEPTLEALAKRLAAHQARGEMIEADPRAAALGLLTPILLAHQHQLQLFGAETFPLNLDDFCRQQVEAFVRAYTCAPQTC